LKKYVVIAEIAFVLIAGAWAVWANREAHIERIRTAEAVAQAKANQKALEALEAYNSRTVIIREKGNAATVRIKESPKAETPVPDDVLSAWRDGIDQLRGEKPASPDNPATVP
jgi:hypothetical protein